MSERRWTIREASEEIREGRLTPVDLLQSCLKQIDRYEEKVRAWVLVDREGAREDAERLTAELMKGHARGPLHGIPIGVKDIFDVRDMPTAAGSKRWANSIARNDAPVVAKLREAGAIILGKTVTTAYASFDPSITRNPWNLNHTPGGSSSGSAAALATGMCLGALASQTGGSINRPATYCGVCGIKPTFNRVNAAGVVPFAASLDHVGAMAGCVTDLAIMLQAMADAGSRDVDAWEVPEPADYTTMLHDAPPYLEAGRFRGMFDNKMEPSLRPIYEETLETLQEAGLSVIDCPLPSAFGEVTPRHQMVMFVEAAAYHEHRFRKYPDDYPPKIRSVIEDGFRVPATEFARTREHQAALKMSIMESFRDGVIVALTPATAGPAPDLSTTGSPIFNSPWSYLGLPTVNIPMGWTPDGLPVALQLVGRPWEEAEVLQMAAWCEQIIDFRPRELSI